MDTTRFLITDRIWTETAPLLSGKEGGSGRTAERDRLFLEGVLCGVRTGVPCRELPDGFGKWNPVHQRFRGWDEKGVFESIFKALRRAIASWCVMGDGTIRRVRQKAADSRKVLGPQAHRTVPRRGDHKDRRAGGCARPTDRFRAAPRPNTRAEAVEARIEGESFEAFIADKAYDADWPLDKLGERNPEMKVVILPKSNRKIQGNYVVEMYKLRRRVEKFFGKVKEKGGSQRDTTITTAATRPAGSSRGCGKP